MIYEYILLLPDGRYVGIGPTTDREQVRTDYFDWLKDTDLAGSIMRRPVSEWELDPDQEYDK